MKRIALTTLAACGCLSAAQAAVVVNVTDAGSTTPIIPAEGTGYTSVNARFGLDGGEAFGQTFTLADAGVLESISFAYNAFLDTHAIDLEITVNGNVVVPSVTLNGSNFSGAASDTATPIYWMRFDFTGDPIALNAGSISFSFAASNEVSSTQAFAFAPMYTNNSGAYAGGSGTGAFYSVGGSAVDDDLAFVVTVIPEPGSLALLGLGGLCVLRRRRHA